MPAPGGRAAGYYRTFAGSQDVLVQREMESGRPCYGVYSHFEGPVWTTPSNVVGQTSMLTLQLVSKRNQVG